MFGHYCFVSVVETRWQTEYTTMAEGQSTFLEEWLSWGTTKEGKVKGASTFIGLQVALRQTALYDYPSQLESWNVRNYPYESWQSSRHLLYGQVLYKKKKKNLLHHLLFSYQCNWWVAYFTHGLGHAKISLCLMVKLQTWGCLKDRVYAKTPRIIAELHMHGFK